MPMSELMHGVVPGVADRASDVSPDTGRGSSTDDVLSDPSSDPSVEPPSEGIPDGTSDDGVSGDGSDDELSDEASDLTRSPLAWLLLGALRLYRASGAIRGSRCRFHPSCSAYAREAVRLHGGVRGTLYALRRLLRCHPWNPGGVDHVPTRE